MPRFDLIVLSVCALTVVCDVSAMQLTKADTLEKKAWEKYFACNQRALRGYEDERFGALDRQELKIAQATIQFCFKQANEMFEEVRKLRNQELSRVSEK